MPSPSQSITAFIALGSNLGDRQAAIRSAVDLLERDERTSVVRCSPLIETAPVGGPAGQGPFLNAACELQTSRSPRELLTLLLEVERRLGRERRERWGPRTIDLDLLLYGDTVLNEPGLTLPHPRMHERAFVLEPLASIAPAVMHPGLGATVSQLLARIQSGSA